MISFITQLCGSWTLIAHTFKREACTDAHMHLENCHIISNSLLNRYPLEPTRLLFEIWIVHVTKKKNELYEGTPRSIDVERFAKKVWIIQFIIIIVLYRIPQLG